MSDEAQQVEPMLKGRVVEFVSNSQPHRTINQVLDYRGDVTITTLDGNSIEGYVFDRRADVDDPYLRIIPKDGGPRRTIRYRQITQVVFSGRNTAAGKSWQAWVKKYNEK